MMKRAIFITVRTASLRLPQKCLLTINGLTTIQYLIRRVKKSKCADIIILCTTELKDDDILCDIAKKEGIECVRGSVLDKLERWRKAAEKYDIDFFVTADGDDLFCEPELIDMAFEQYRKTNSDFIEAPNVPCGAFSYGIKVKALKKVCRIKNTKDTEMMWAYFKDTNLFNVEQLHGIPREYQRPEIRMTLDYKEDFEFFTSIITHFSQTKKDFILRDIISFLDQHPEVIKINQHMQNVFLDNQARKTKLILKKGSV